VRQGLTPANHFNCPLIPLVWVYCKSETTPVPELNDSITPTVNNIRNRIFEGEHDVGVCKHSVQVNVWT
jgi:hypothetical protein